MPDVKGTLFWLAIVLLLLLWMMNGCGSRIDEFREHRRERQQDRQEQREERRDDWQQWWNERERWRDRKRRVRSI